MTKRILLFSYFILGLTLTEIGCNNDDWGGGCKPELHEILSVDPALALHVTEEQAIFGLNDGDTIAYNQMWFAIPFKTNRQTTKHELNWSNLAYATPPCPPPRLEPIVDSIMVSQLDNNNAIVSDFFELNGTPLVHSGGQYSSWLEIYGPPFEPELRITRKGLDELETRYSFEFFFSDSTTFTSVSPSIYITMN